jgi:hypothetical protein
LKSIKKVGSTSQVNLVAQIDSRGQGSTYRFLLKDERSSLDEDVVDGPLPEINTGDPRELTDFIRWGMEKYPAEHTMLVLWGHGRGWENQENAVRAAPLASDVIQYKNRKGAELEGWSIARTRGGEIRRFLRTGGQEGETAKLNKMLHKGDSSTVQYAGGFTGRYFSASRPKDTDNDDVVGFLMDQTASEALASSQDVLRMDELSSALEKGLDGKSKGKFDILGMDSCLMGMIEVGYQVKASVDYLVATEDTIPDDGWPYDRIMARLVACPDLSPEDFSATIVREYLIHYREQRTDVAMSVCNLTRSKQLLSPLKELAADLKNKLSDDKVRLAVLGSRASAQNYYVKDYVDLYDFCSKLQKLCPDEKVKSGCGKVMNAIRRSEEKGRPSKNPEQDGFVSENGFIGHRLRGSNGVSLYFPIVEPSAKYAELPFAQDSGWHGFLNALAGLFPEIERPGKDASANGGLDSGVKGNGNGGGCDGLKNCAGTEEKFGQPMVQIVPGIRRRDCT